MNSSTADVISTDLLLNNYTTRSDGKVFNGDILSSIFEKVTGEPDANYSMLEIMARDTEGKGAINELKSGRDATQIKTDNGNKHVVITLGGMEWTVMALTTDADSDPILTLILTDVAPGETSKWSAWTSSDYTSGDYPAQMYSTSYVRAQLLNGKNANGDDVKYSTSNSTLTTFTRPSMLGSYKFDIFAHSNATGSITNYLVQPKNVPYQYDMNYYTAHNGVWTGAYNYNETSRDKIGISPHGEMENKANYFDWASDYIWLPTTTEMGWGQATSPSFTGIWNASSFVAIECFGTSNNYWFRTTGNHSIGSVGYGKSDLSAVGTWGSISDTYYIRPCIHLNLADAYESSIKYLDVPQNATMTYTSERIGVHSMPNLPTWYDESIYEDSDIITTVYKDSAGVAINGSPRDEGEYTVEYTFTTQGKKKYAWSNSDTNSSDMRSITFKITPKPIKYTLSGGESSLPKVEHDVSDLGKNDKNLAQGKVLGFKYTGIHGSTWTKPDVIPNVNGEYKATVISLNHNYTPDPSVTPNYKEFKVEGSRAYLPTFDEAKQGYDGGNPVSFVMQGFDANKIRVVTPLPSGVSYDGGEV
ncbi:MAG: hypothetical protein K2L53_04245, partial [Clostridia bacterium]|nr:hypothetical protein [Clostridia bacterium]